MIIRAFFIRFRESETNIEFVEITVSLMYLLMPLNPYFYILFASMVNSNELFLLWN
ncbi:hypothetical protein JCM19298_1036 [Nonlabens ulvanivorans]|nr:hypothetical protein JCM19298_1036 [Nonlabens ulvanivorans]